MAEGVDTIARHTFSKERQPQAMSDTISLISHPSKIMLGVILNQLKAKAEELLAEEQTDFKPGWSTVKPIFSSRVIKDWFKPFRRYMRTAAVQFS